MIVLIGPTGAGKSTQGELLAKRLGYVWISTGELLRRAKDELTVTTLGQGKLVEAVSGQDFNKLITEEIEKYPLNKIILDGYPREVKQAKHLDQYLEEKGQRLSRVIVINVSKGTILHRLAKRGRSDDTKAAIQQRLVIYKARTLPVVDYYKQNGTEVIEVDGDQAIEAVYQQVTRNLNGTN